MESSRWTNLERVEMYMKNPAEWTQWEARGRESQIKALFDSEPPSVRVKVKVLLQDNLQNFKARFVSLRDFIGGRTDKPKVHNSILDVKDDGSILLHECSHFVKKIIRILTMRSAEPSVSHSIDVKEAILKSLKQSECKLSNGGSSLRSHGMIEHLNWECQPNGSTTETLLVWHIATTLFHHQKSPLQQTNDPFRKEQEVALSLSNYCHYLVSSLPKLLPDEAHWTEKTYKYVKEEIQEGIDQSSSLPTRDRCNHVLQHRWGVNSVVGKGAKIVNVLSNYAKQDELRMWKMLAEFWAEMMLFIAPSDNVEGHKEILERRELITQIWALLTHAGILTRPKMRNGVTIG